jgi:hypothetical protein
MPGSLAAIYLPTPNTRLLNKKSKERRGIEIRVLSLFLDLEMMKLLRRPWAKRLRTLRIIVVFKIKLNY